MNSGGLNTFGLEAKGSNSSQESSSDEDSTDSSDGFSANEPLEYQQDNGSAQGVSWSQHSGGGVQTKSRDRLKSIHPTNSELG